MALSVLWLEPSRVPTGIGSYCREVAPRVGEVLRGRGVGWERREVEFPELSLGSVRVGGLVSRLAFQELGGWGERGWDVVHAANHSVWRRDVDVLTVYDLHLFTHPEEYGGSSWMWRRAWRRVDEVEVFLCISEWTAGELGRVLGVDDDRVLVTPLGVDTDVFFPDPLWSGVEEVGLDVLVVGSWMPRKRVLEVVEACALVGEWLGGRVVLHRVGPRSGSGYEGEVLARVEELGVELVDHGYVSRELLRGLYSSVDVLAFPSADEGFGLPPVEAAACGTPSVVGPCPVFDEVLGGACLAVRDPVDADGVAKALFRAVDGWAPSRERLVKVASGLSWDVAVEGVLEGYGRVLGW